MSTPAAGFATPVHNGSIASSTEAAENRAELERVKEELKKTVTQFNPGSRSSTPGFKTRAEAKTWQVMEGQQARKKLAQLEQKLQKLQQADIQFKTLSATSAAGSTTSEQAPYTNGSGRVGVAVPRSDTLRGTTPPTGVLRNPRAGSADNGPVASANGGAAPIGLERKKSVLWNGKDSTSERPSSLRTLGLVSYHQNQNPSEDDPTNTTPSGRRPGTTSPASLRPTSYGSPVDRFVVDEDERVGTPFANRRSLYTSGYSQRSAQQSADGRADQGYVSVAELRQVLREMQEEKEGPFTRNASSPYASPMRGMTSSGRRGSVSPPRTAPKRVESGGDGDQKTGGAESIKEGGIETSQTSRSDDAESETDSAAYARVRATKQLYVVPKTLGEATAVSCPILFGGFSRSSPIRMKCFQIYKSPRWQTLFLSVTLANCIYIAVSPDTAADPEANSSFDFLKVFDFFCVGVLLFEVCISIIAFGFAGDPSTWLKNSDVHKFDFAVVCVTIFEYVAATFGIRGLTLRPFRLLRVFKAMVMLRTFANVKAIITTLRQGLGQLLVVFAMLLFFVAAFAVFGMAIFQNSFRRRCIAQDRQVPACASDFSTGWNATCNFTNMSETVTEPAGELIVSAGYPGIMLCKILYNTTAGQYDGEYPLDPYGRYHTCKEWEMCETLENPRMGQQHFDHIGGAMVTIFQIAASDGNYDVIWNSLESEPQVFEAIWVYYFMISCLCTFLLLGLFVAVVTGTFKRVRETQSAKYMTEVLNGADNPGEEEQVGEDETEAEAQERIHMQELEKKMVKYRSLVERSATFVIRNRVADIKAQEKDETEDSIPVDLFALHLLRSKHFINFMSVVIVVHCLAMGADQYNAPKVWNDYATITYVVANVLFLCELLVRFLAFGGLKHFWAVNTNQSELLITLLGILGLILNSPFMIRIPALRLYRLMRYIPTLQALLFSAVASTRAILNLVIFIAVVAVCFAVAGRYVFQDKMDSITRSNFGSFADAMLTVFQLMTGDSWSAVLFSAMSVMTTLYGTIFAAVFVMSWFIFSRLIVTNLFVAVIIENFEVSETIENIRKPGYLSRIRGLFRKAALRLFVVQSNLRGRQVKLDKHGHLVYKAPLSATLTKAASAKKEERKASLVHHHHHKASEVFHSAEDESKFLGKRRGSLVTGANKNQFASVWSTHGANFGFAFSKSKDKNDAVAEVAADPKSKTSDAKGKASDAKGASHAKGAEAGMTAEPEPVEDSLKSDSTASVFDPHVTPLNDIMEDVGDLEHYRNLVSQVLPKGKWNEKAVEDALDDTSLGCLGPSHPVRRFAEWLSDRLLFDAVIYIAILGGCFFLVITPPFEDMPWQQSMISFETMDLWNRVFTIIFSVEFFTRVVSKGFLFTKHAYLKSGWNVMDSLVLLFAWIDEFQLINGGGVAKVMRLARALRPLRLMKRNQGMRIVIDALISTLAPVAYVVAFSMFTFVVFSLVGIGLFGGMFFHCTQPGAEWPSGLAECSGLHVRDNGIMVPRAWESPPHNFDSFYNAMFTLFRVNTLKYVAVVSDAMDITEFQKSPKEGHSMYYSVFFIIYLIIGALFVMNLFVGFIVDGFNANKGSTQADLQFNRFIRSIGEHKPKYERFTPPTNPLSAAMRSLVASRWFQILSVTCVFLNVVFMMTDHAGASDEFRSFMTTQNLVFFIELCAELVIFFIAFGPGGFYNDLWKAFDFFVCIGSMVGYIQDSPRTTQFARTFRLMRVIRLMKMIGPIRIILETLLASLPQLVNVVLLLFLVYSMFAVVAVQTFGTTRYGGRLGPTANFETYGNAMFTLYQMVTGDEWNLIMDDCSIQEPACTEIFTKLDEMGFSTGYAGPDLSFGDCGSAYAGFFFVVFIIVCESVMLNLFIGMILDNFSFITDEVAEIEDANWDTGASSGQIIALANIFKQHDSGTCLCAISGIHFLMSVMPQPLGFRSPSGKLRYGDEEKAAEKLIRAELNLIVRQGYEEDRRIRRQWWRKLCPLILMPPPKALSQSVTFEQLMLTLLYWRKVTMIPSVVKAARVGVINEVVVLAHALTLKDVLLRPVAARKQRQTRKALIPRATFVQWARVDMHYNRRFMALAEMIYALRIKAERRGIWRQFRVVPPAKTVQAELVPFDALPEPFTPHQEVVRSDLHIKFAKPPHGLEALRTRAATDAVALRFVDARNRPASGIIGLDLSSIDWAGWEPLELREDLIFRPHTRKQRLDDSSPSWLKVDLRMRTEQDKRQDGMTGEYKTSLVGSILDIQAFALKEHVPDEKHPVLHSKVRVNVGLVSESASLTGAARFGFGRVPPCYDGCMEVLGYFPLDELARRVDFIKLSMQEAGRKVLPEDMIGADTMTMRPRGHGSPPATAGARRAEFPNQYLGQGDAEDTSVHAPNAA